MRRANFLIATAYGIALVVAIAVGLAVPYEHSLVVAGVADVAATLAIFAFSFGYGNSSFYDAYWSVAPIPIVLYWAASAEDASVSGLRQLLVVVAVILWGTRLTYNWFRGWRGLDHEDWRYVDLRRKSGSAYWLVSFTGLHLFPTAVVFLACMPAWAAVALGTRPIGLLDAVAMTVCVGAVWIEARADKELHLFRASSPPPTAVLRSGLWSLSRHPNYFGEMSFWWGLWLFGVAAAPEAWWWTVPGPLVITSMFRFVSLPIMEQRMLIRRPGYAEHAARTSLVVPRPPRGRM